MDEATTEATEQTEEVEGSGPKQLRDALKREKEKNARLTSIALGNAFKQVGLNPEKGLGKAIAKEYEGDPTAEGVAEYAKTEYDWEVPEGTVNAEAAERRDKQAPDKGVAGIPSGAVSAVATWRRASPAASARRRAPRRTRSAGPPARATHRRA